MMTLVSDVENMSSIEHALSLQQVIIICGLDSKFKLWRSWNILFTQMSDN